MKSRMLNRLIAALLCFAMLLPNFTGLVTAVDSVKAQSVQTNNKWVPVSDPFAAGEIPAYQTAGAVTPNALVTDCGNGVTRDQAKSYLKMVTGTTDLEFLAFKAAMVSAGFTITASRNMPGSQDYNIFYRFLSPGKNYVVTAYYVAKLGEAHIVADTGEDAVKSFSTGFVYNSKTNEVAQTMMTMYGLSMSQNGYDGQLTTSAYNDDLKRNCGALIVIRMPDNSLFVNDGGDVQQWSDEACADFMAFCRELTGKQEGEKVVINSWFISHAHSDHYNGIPRFFAKYHDQIDILNVMYNIDDERANTTRDMTDVLNMVAAYFPSAKYYKPHTGDHFDIAGVEFDVLYTQEDRFYPGADGNLNIGDVSLKTSDGGTYRDYLYNNAELLQTDFNDTSTVLRVTFPETFTGGDAVTSNLYADVNLGDTTIRDMWPVETLASDIMMVPHHGHDAHPELVAASKSSVYLFTQAKMAIYGPNGIVDEDVDQDGTYRPKLVQNFIAMNDQDADGDGKADGYFETTAAHKTYWEGTETACILFGEDTTFQNKPTGLTEDPESPNGFTVYTAEAKQFRYTGWSVIPDVFTGESVTTNEVSTTTHIFPLIGVKLDTDDVNDNILTAGSLYAIVHDKTDQLMSYDVLMSTKSAPALAQSIKVGTVAQALAGKVESHYRKVDGEIVDARLYVSHDRRNDVLWELNFTNPLTDETITYTNGSPKFGGVTAEYFNRSIWYKGTQSEAQPFWELTESTVDGSFRFLQPHRASVIHNKLDPNDKLGNGGIGTYNIRIEFFDEENGTVRDGIKEQIDTCVIYYSSGSDDFRFLTVDAEGNWIRKQYTTVADVKADLENLKLRLYRYNPSDTYSNKTVAVEGPMDYTVLKGLAAETLAKEISSVIRVMDTSRNNLPIAFSGTTAKVGYYWLDMSNYDGLNNCTVSVMYCNDDGSSTKITELTINMIDSYEMYAAYNDDDTVYAGSKYGSKYGFMYVGENVIYEEVVNHTIVMDMLVSVKDHQNGYTTTNINITPNMLVDDDGNAVDFSTPGIYPNLSLVYDGEVIDTGYTIQVSQSDSSLQYPSAGAVGSVTVNKQGTTGEKNFLSTGVANIQLSANSIPEEKGVDLVVVLDLSGSMTKEVNSNNNAADYSDTRMAVMEESLREMIATLQGSGKDVRIAMSDFGDLDHYTFPGAVTTNSNFHRPYYDINKDLSVNIAYEFFNHLNFFISRNADGTVDFDAGIYETSNKKYNMAHSQYTGVVTPTVYTGTGEISAEAFVSVDTLGSEAMTSLIAKLDENVEASLGTNYDIGLEYAYRLGHAIRKENEANGQDRELVCIFLSDGAAIQYNYFAGRTASTSWRDILNGVPDEVTSLSDYYADQSNWPEELENISRVMLELLATKAGNQGFSQLLTNEFRTRSSHEYFRYYLKNDKNLTAGYTYRYFYTYMDHQGYELDWPFLQKLAKANGLDNFERGEKGFNYTYVDAEGVTHTVTDDNVLQPLIDLFTDKSTPVYTTDEAGNQVVNYYTSKLKSPDYFNKGNPDYQGPEYEYTSAYYRYPKFNGTIITDGSVSYTDQLFAAMESVGYPCDWNLYADLVFVNKEAIDNALDPDDLKDPLDEEDPTKHQDIESTDLRNLIQKIKTPTGTENGVYQTLSPYAYFYNAEGKNWWAEAIKGNTDQLYPVINKYALENNPNWTDAYYGDVRNRFTTGTGLALDGQDFISGFAGLDMALYTVSFAIADDRLLTSQTAENVLKNIATGPNYFYSAASGEKLTEALNSIVSTLTASATRAWFTDTMGPDFDLSTEKTVLSHDGVWVTVNGNPTVKVMEYDLVEITDAQGNTTFVRAETPRVLETVTFEDIDGDGDVDAWSDQVYTTSEVNGVIVHNKVDIWNEETGLISAKKFYYNANTDKSVTLPFGAEGSYSLPAETFFWIIGVLGETEIVLEYQVYLTGSIEGDRLLTSEDYYHATNTNAVLHYINYLGQDSTLDTISPKYPWGDAKLGYGYYLVNEQGQMLANRLTGETTTDFSKAIRLTRPVYEYLTWNADNTLLSGSVAANTHRPDGRTLFSPQAAYTTDLTFDGSGSWTITDTTNTTYVVLDGTAYNANQNFAAGAYANAETVVWFAIVDRSPATAPDTVVVDYGIPVDIDVSSNDELIGKKGNLAALGKSDLSIAYSGNTLTGGYSADPYPGTYGDATIENGKVHYELTTMEMSGSEQFNYALYYTPAGTETDVYAGYYYSTVTVIPATSIYFEDDFAQYHTYNYDSSKAKFVLSDENKWTVAKDENFDSLQGAHQDEDRPGSAILPEIDADNIYGFDSAYENCSMYSLGSSKKFTANATYAGAVNFSFYGTGFDVVSLTSSDTGTIIVDVYNAEGYVQDQSTPIKSLIVDTYYGYTYDKENDEWVVTPNSDTLYQVPVMKVSDLQYGHYTAVITVSYASFFDHNTADASYDFYMDAVRIYDPADNDGSNDAEAGGAYVEDGEFAPVYKELRNILITEREFYDSTANLGDGYLHGAVFIDGIPVLNEDNYDTSFKKDPPEIGTYLNYGPNNEVYLAPGQAIAFELNSVEGLKAVHLAMKSTGGTAKIKMFSAAVNISDVSGMEIGTATDRYYDLTELIGKTVIIANVGTAADGILSITNLKFTADPNAAQITSVDDVVVFSMRSASRALKALTPGDKEQGNVPGENIPGTGDQEQLMISLIVLACLSMTAVVLLVHMDRRLVKRRKTR